jgi:hypothetical protein
VRHVGLEQCETAVSRGLTLRDGRARRLAALQFEIQAGLAAGDREVVSRAHQELKAMQTVRGGGDDGDGSA